MLVMRMFVVLITVFKKIKGLYVQYLKINFNIIKLRDIQTTFGCKNKI